MKPFVGFEDVFEFLPKVQGDCSMLLVLDESDTEPITATLCRKDEMIYLSQEYENTFPRYSHACTRCLFLGNYTSTDTIYDLYYCPKRISTMVARYGNKPWEYISGMVSSEPVIQHAKDKARERGFKL